MNDLAGESARELRRIAEAWLAAFNTALAGKCYRAAAEMMIADCYWRDLLTFGWEFRTCHGIDEIEAGLARYYDSAGSDGLRLENDPTLGRLGEFGKTIEFFVSFTTNVAVGRGHVRLLAAPNEPSTFKAFTLFTALKDLKDFPELMRREKPRDGMPIPARDSQNWLDRRNKIREFSERDPDVIVIGAGMAGLMVAARLGQLDISTLVVDRLERVGDIWRKRYRSLVLHNEICTNHFPYLPFPDTWPVYIPKDKLANWLEFYADAMELNIWTRTTFLSGEFNSDNRWTVRLQRADGSIRIMRPSEIILATGVSGVPNMPRFPGIEKFRGTMIHSSGQTDELAVEGKSVLVVGSGTSGHDIAQDLYIRGADVTMLQRSPTTVVSLEPSSIRVHELYKRNEGVRPLEDVDMMVTAIPYDLVRRLHGPLSKQMIEDDKVLLDGLRKVGFALDNGEDDTGYFLKLLRYQAGYYLNVGASELIIERKVKLKSGVEIDHLTENEAIFSDGSGVKVDILVLATGYLPLQEGVRAMLGDEVADRVGPIWGIGEDGELRNMYAPTRQEGFYVMGGGFIGCRTYSHYTARYIKAKLEGLLCPRPVREMQVQEAH